MSFSDKFSRALKAVQSFLSPSSLRVPRTQVVELQIEQAGTANFNLPDSTTLRQRTIVGLRIRVQNTESNKLSISGRQLISRAALNSAFLTLVFDGTNVIENTPLEFFTNENNHESYCEILMPGGFDPTKSTIKFANPSAISSGQSVELIFIYLPGTVNEYC